MGDPETVEAVRVDGRRITAVGGLEDLRSLGDADVVDLDGRCLMPGFVDAHTHPLMHGQCASWADLSGAASIDEVVKLLREHARGLGAAAAIRGYAGLPVVLSSDAPVTVPDVPMACWSAETRLTSAGHVLGAEARVTRREAFEGYTTGGALALRRTDVGAIGPGMLADLVILDDDPLAVEIDRLPDVGVNETWMDGRQVWAC